MEFSEDTQGSGFFSGKQGGFYLLSNDTDKPKLEIKQSKSVDKMSLEETSQVLNQKIQNLEKDKIELEILKKQIDKKLAE